MNVVQQNPPELPGSEKVLESGLLEPMLPNMREVIESVDTSGTEGFDQDFEGALESMENSPVFRDHWDIPTKSLI